MWPRDLVIGSRLRPISIESDLNMKFGKCCFKALQFVKLPHKCHASGVEVSVPQAINATELDNIPVQHGLRRLVSVEPTTATTIWLCSKDY